MDIKYHCVYCGAEGPLVHGLPILGNVTPEELKDIVIFETIHDTRCGPKSVGAICELGSPEVS